MPAWASPSQTLTNAWGPRVSRGVETALAATSAPAALASISTATGTRAWVRSGPVVCTLPRPVGKAGRVSAWTWKGQHSDLWVPWNPEGLSLCSVPGSALPCMEAPVAASPGHRPLSSHHVPPLLLSLPDTPRTPSSPLSWPLLFPGVNEARLCLAPLG